MDENSLGRSKSTSSLLYPDHRQDLNYTSFVRYSLTPSSSYLVPCAVSPECSNSSRGSLWSINSAQYANYQYALHDLAAAKLWKQQQQHQKHGSRPYSDLYSPSTPAGQFMLSDRASYSNLPAECYSINQRSPRCAPPADLYCVPLEPEEYFLPAQASRNGRESFYPSPPTDFKDTVVCDDSQSNEKIHSLHHYSVAPNNSYCLQKSPPIYANTEDLGCRRRRCASGGEDQLRKVIQVSRMRSCSLRPCQNNVIEGTEKSKDIIVRSSCAAKVKGKAGKFKEPEKMKSNSYNYLWKCFSPTSLSSNKLIANKEALIKQAPSRKDRLECLKQTSFSLSSPSIQEVKWSKANPRSKSYVFRKSLKKLKTFARSYTRRTSKQDKHLKSFEIELEECKKGGGEGGKAETPPQAPSQFGRNISSAVTNSFIGASCLLSHASSADAEAYPSRYSL